MPHKMLRRNVLALTILSALAAGGQQAFASGETTGAVSGAVTRGNITANTVEVVIRRADTGLERRHVIDANGSFRFNQLPIGEYKVVVLADGKQMSEQVVVVGLGSQSNLRFDLDAPDRLEIVGARAAVINHRDTTSGIEMSESELDRVPVARSLTDIALLAPGVIEGDSGFTWAGRQLPSFSGSSVAENNYYINGLSVANFRTGLGAAEVPFEFLKQVQIKTGGYSAEFGRSTGGVINMVSKTGTNEFEAAISGYWKPEFLIKRQRDLKNYDGTSCYECSTSRDEDDEKRFNITAGGPLVKDKLFYYVLLAPRKIESESYGTTDESSTSENEQWGATLTWQISDDHRLEAMGFSDQREYTTDTQGYKLGPNGVLYGEYGVGTLPSLQGVAYRPSSSTEITGGENKVVTYYGNIGSDISVKAMLGESVRNNSTVNGDTAPYVEYYYFYRNGAPDRRSLGQTRRVSETTLSRQSDTEDVNRQFRLDAEWLVGDNHQIRAGLDNMELTTTYNIRNTGGARYTYYFLNALDLVPYNAMRTTYSNIGTYKSDAKAKYIEDLWQVTDNFMLSLGLRHEVFDNKDGDGESFMKSEDLLAPRLGASWDVFGDGSAKAYASVGRFFLPIPNNVNADLAGKVYSRDERFLAKCFKFNPGQVPTFLCDKADRYDTIYRAGLSQPAHEIVDQDGLDPMYQDEINIGYETNLPWLGEGWVGTVEFNNRVMENFIDDVQFREALLAYIDANKIAASAAALKSIQDRDLYAMMNPGEALDIKWDFGDGRGLVPVTLGTNYLPMPRGERKYRGLKFLLNKRWNGQYSFSASYTLSKTMGNTEGAVNSDTNNTLSTRTDVFDLPELMLGSYGYTPNDRRHQVKLFGSYAIMEDWTVGANLSWASGRPLSCYGGFPDGRANDERRTGFFCDGKVVARGSAGRMPGVTTLSLNTIYNFTVFGMEGQLALNLYNPFGWDTATDFVQSKERYLASADPETNNYPVVANENHGLPTVLQAGRSGQISFELKF